ncbi:MAG TPA: beta-galactosidase [Segeticoccus sp.]|uniref:beta-galactosidase n=1 Tax=Segeticoccus sp. TaxID=2706531 RepID=UPI002D7E7AE1|nr:beta-galactosidase [Segeticoccus sp.]HET8599997.1 beta-galactosidase [Segeticoccus sp.]
MRRRPATLAALAVSAGLAFLSAPTALGAPALSMGASTSASSARSGSAAAAAGSAAAPTAHPFPGNDGRAHRVSWDAKSLEVDGQRLDLVSGELHYWRLPSPDQWRDVLQKMKANGFNAVSLYFFWGYHSSRPGHYDFTGIRDVDRLLTMAAQEGLYVIARPGPYVNAEASMGGLAAYTANFGGPSRSTDPQNLRADLEWLAAINQVIARHQVTDGGGSVLAYQVENEQINHSQANIDYIERLQQAVKDDGITVPLFHNDWGDGHGWNAPGKPGGSQLDLYAFDTYPLGFDCAGGRGRLSDYEQRIRSYSPNTPVFIAEGQGGAFTAWGRNFQTSHCADFVDGPFTRQFEANNLANGATMVNTYMEFGGTNWGWTGDPGSGFTSYDYGAPIAEDRTMRPKLAVQKEYNYLKGSVTPIASATAVEPPRVTATGGAVEANQRLSTEHADTQSVSGNGTRIITLRHANSNDTSMSHVTFPLDLATQPTPPEAPSYRWNDSDVKAISYSGNWTHASGESWTSGDYQDDETFSDRAGDSLTVTFDGPVIRWIGPDSGNHGTADVYIDGTKKATVDSYASSATFQQVKFEADHLGDGPHTMKIVVTGQKGTPASQGTFVSVDGIDTEPTDQPGPPPSDSAYPRVPQQPGTSITIDGRDATTLVADYAFGGHLMPYSTSQVLTELPDPSLLVLTGEEGTDGETVLRYDSRPTVTTLDGNPVQVTWDAARKDLRLDYQHTGSRTLRITGGGMPELTLLITDRAAVAHTWRTDSPAGPVLVVGPELVRSAEVHGANLFLTGDTRAAGPVRVFVPQGVSAIHWNDKTIATSVDAAGALVGSLPGPGAQPLLPTLTTWRTHASDPERQPGFDDSSWTVADKTRVPNTWHGPGRSAGVVLDAEEYGFLEGDVWYRGHYTPSREASSITVDVKTGTAGDALVWLNGHYLGAQGDGSHDYAVPAGTAPAGSPAVLSVLVRNMGQYEDWSANGRSKHGRGLFDAAIPGSGDVTWRLQGAAGGDQPADTARGLYNNGGLFGERQGWSLPGAPDGSWSRTSSLTSDRPGVQWYRTTVQLHPQQGVDRPLAVHVSDDSNRAERYRMLIFVNGWNTGQYVNNVGPQDEFVIPSGFLKPGTNTIALAVTSEQGGVGPESVSLVDHGAVLGGVRQATNPAPDWSDLFGG